MTNTFDKMYSELGLCAVYEIVYSLLGEVQSSTLETRPVQPNSAYAEQIQDAVNVRGMLVNRCEFHGYGTVLIHDVKKIMD